MHTFAKLSFLLLPSLHSLESPSSFTYTFHLYWTSWNTRTRIDIVKENGKLQEWNDCDQFLNQVLPIGPGH